LRIGDLVQKEELLHLHMLLVHVKKYYETVYGQEFRTDVYDEMSISPVHIHKNKVCHKKAILTLGKEIVENIKENRPSVVDYSQRSEEVIVEH